MKKFTLVLLTVFTGLLFHNPLLAQWVKTNGPFGGSIKCILADNSHLLIGTNNGVYSSADNGKSWAVAGKNNLQMTVRSIAVAGDDYFAATDFSVFRMTASGWQAVNNGLPPRTWVRSLAVSGNSLFAGTLYHGVYRSTDSGAHWQVVNNGLPGGYAIVSLAVSDTTLIAGTYAGIFVSRDNGGHWLPSRNGLPQSVAIVALAVSGNHIFAGTFNHGVYVSDDEGKSWKAANSGLPVGGDNGIKVTSMAVSDSLLLTGTAHHGVFFSSDGGKTWKGTASFKDNDTAMVSISAVAIYHTTFFAGTKEKGMFRSVNSGQTWTADNDGITGIYVNALASLNGRVFAAGNDIYTTTDRGGSWKAARSGISINKDFFSRTFLTVSDSAVYAATYLRGVYRFSTAGENWKPINQGLPSPNVTVLAATGHDIFTGLWLRSLFRYSYETHQWVAASAGLPKTDDIISFTSTGTYLFAGTKASGVYRSADNGQSWTKVSAGLPVAYPINTMKALGPKVFAGTDNGIYRTTDGGDNWQKVGNGMPVGVPVTTLAVSGSDVFAGTISKGVYVSYDQGDNWVEFNSGLPKNSQINAITVSDSTIYVAEERPLFGVWRRSLSDVLAGVRQLPDQSSSFVLNKNFPNPFRRATTIEYSLPVKGLVTLSVYNFVGQKVGSLVHSVQNAGTYQVQWNALDLPAGIYFYNLRVTGKRNFSAAKKMVLIK